MQNLMQTIHFPFSFFFVILSVLVKITMSEITIFYSLLYFHTWDDLSGFWDENEFPEEKNILMVSFQQTL